MKKRINLLREFSIPLMTGVLLAMIWANRAPESYQDFITFPLFGGISFHFISNELFMTLFFGIAAAEITRSCLPGGDLNPISKAVNPLLATVGGVIGPVAVYILLARWWHAPELLRGWGIPTATDIAFAWLVARLVFGKRHPAVTYLLLLAIADDAVGLAIIAIFYPDPLLPVAPAWLLLTVGGMFASWFLRRLRVESYWPYLLIGGAFSWGGLSMAHLHPALALVFVVPFLPAYRQKSHQLFDVDTYSSPLSRFEHEWKVPVDFGLFLFGLANAGIGFSEIGLATWLVLTALIVGKSIGITLCGWIGSLLGFPLPKGVGPKELAIVGMVAGIGFTVALFIASEAFNDQQLQGAAKMGALFSIIAAPMAWFMALLFGIRKIERE